MKVTIGSITVKEIVEDVKEQNITVNSEYQRAAVWSPDQQKRLIDSILRGYQLPIFYLHEIPKTNARGDQWRVYQIIDGQQRCNALERFIHGDLQLLDVEDEKSKLPAFLRDTTKFPCPWSGQRSDTLPKEYLERLLETKLTVAYITEADDVEVRDLFIRLQSGSALNNQEKRDAYPGQFTEFILKLGGKEELKLNGYDFFKKLVRRRSRIDRGEIRQLAAQITILFLERREKGIIVDGGREKIDEYYDTMQDFDAFSGDCQRLLAIIQKLESLLANWNGPKFAGHNAICLVLFVDSIFDDYTRAWEDSFESALKEFFKFYEEGRQANKDGQYHAAWQDYGQYAGSASDNADRIRRRQDCFSAFMTNTLESHLVPKDPKRSFTELEKRAIFWRESGNCQNCEGPVKWEEAVYHHIVPHKNGGKTVVTNGALVHADCHPLSDEDMRDFAEKLGQVVA